MDCHKISEFWGGGGGGGGEEEIIVLKDRLPFNMMKIPHFEIIYYIYILYIINYIIINRRSGMREEYKHKKG